uniref:PH domain-containing protein n=1 Tax=Arcella intermedia TaxID=1963864 RepID=A0A6B2L4T3_9EUKA
MQQPDKAGWMTKQGGNFKTWKRRWFVLKNNKIYYFKRQKDIEVTGIIELHPNSSVKPVQIKGKNFVFSVSTPTRVYFMFPEAEEDEQFWIEAIQGTLDKMNGKGAEPQKTNQVQIQEPVKNEVTMSAKLDIVRKVVQFLNSEDSKVIEFWQIWKDSLPKLNELDGVAYYEIAVSVGLEKLSWRISGPQHIFIQRMVDFFWNVGAPEPEIDRLNDIGSSINPAVIGSWIDMSEKGGMDGGWFFPVEIASGVGLVAADVGAPVTIFDRWVRQHEITHFMSIGRDMGAAPPRQTEYRFNIPGGSFAVQYGIAMDAIATFKFPPFPSPAAELLSQSSEQCGSLGMSVITSSEGFVKIGIFVGRPSKALVEGCFRICEISDTVQSKMKTLEGSFGATLPIFVEFVYVNDGFGYGVYREGFDVLFHYRMGEEGPYKN